MSYSETRCARCGATEAYNEDSPDNFAVVDGTVLCGLCYLSGETEKKGEPEVAESEPTCYEDSPDSYVPLPGNTHTCEVCGASWGEITDDLGHYHIVEYSLCSCRD